MATSRGRKDATFANFPGGAIELGEAPLDALRREFIEETGLVVEPVRLLHASTEFHRSVVKPKRQLLGLYWLVERTGGELKNGNGSDVVSVQFVPLDQLEQQDFTSFDREALPAVKAAFAKTPRARHKTSQRATE